MNIFSSLTDQDADGRSTQKEKLGKSGRGFEITDYSEFKAGAQYIGLSVQSRTMRILLTGMIFLFLLFAGKASALQLIRGNYYREQAEGNRIRILSTPAPRGILFDRSGLPLVQNTPDFSLVMNPSLIRSDEDKTEIFEILEPQGISHIELNRIIEQNAEQDRWIAVKEHLGHESAIKLAALTADVTALSVNMPLRRDYLTDEAQSLSHILGYVGKLEEDEIIKLRPEGYMADEYIGKTGLEYSYEKTLRGTSGKKQIEVDAMGREQKMLAGGEPIPGGDIITGIDFELQKKTEEILRAHLSAAKKTRGAVVMLEPKTGEVRAMVSVPSFDANKFSFGISGEEYKKLIEDADKPLFQRAVAGTYQSGSTIKPAVALAALAEKIITPRTTILSTGGIQVSRWFFPDWREGGHGPTDVFGAIADSVNTFFYYVGGGYGNFEGLGPERLAAWAHRFGLGYKTEIDLPGEQEGLIPTKDWKERARNEPWYIGDTYHFAIGQGDVLVTPIQMAQVTAAIANRGVKIKPHVAKEIIDSHGGRAQVPIERENLPPYDESAWRTVALGMKRAVTDGSARRLSLLPVSSAGKTGTAQWREDKSPHAWFIGFAPFDEPELAFAVIVEEGGEGSAIAVPIIYDILKWWFSPAQLSVASR